MGVIGFLEGSGDVWVQRSRLDVCLEDPGVQVGVEEVRGRKPVAVASPVISGNELKVRWGDIAKVKGDRLEGR